MAVEKVPLSERVAHHFSLLSEAAVDLNLISSELGRYISDIDLALKKLNLGVVAWTTISGNDGEPDASWYWREDLGYAKVGSNWGICLRKVKGDSRGPEDEAEGRWLFNDAPRSPFPGVP